VHEERAATNINQIEIVEVVKEFPGGVRAVDGVSLDVLDGEFLVLVGPSGCGKTTLLRMIAGLEEVSDGCIFVGGRDVTHLPVRDRDIAMVFQNYALYPHMTVERNLGYGLKVRGTPRQTIRSRVADVARMLVLDGLLARRPAALSGGQRQRVAIGRAITREPVAFLMDEPLSNLDAKLRVTMRAELARLHQRLGVTTVYVTHDQVEAMTLGHRVAVMRDGILQQVDRPQVLYSRPSNLFVAAFIGSPAMNLVEAVVEGGEVMFGGLRVPIASHFQPATRGPVILGIRPEAFEDAQFADANLPTVDVQIDVVEIRDASDGEDDTLLAHEQATFIARVSPESRAAVGASLRLAVNPARFHYFDPATGAALNQAGQAAEALVHIAGAPV
jgi:multiple sugar transport system ATP-binding protein